jgi:hypothetical protein
MATVATEPEPKRQKLPVRLLSDRGESKLNPPIRRKACARSPE